MPTEEEWVDAVDAAAVGDTALGVRVAGSAVILLRVGDEIRAYAGLCPHDKTLLDGAHVEAGRLVCPRHRAAFDLATGAVGAGWSLPPLARYPSKVVDGRVWIDRRAVCRRPAAGRRDRWDLTRC